MTISPPPDPTVALFGLADLTLLAAEIFSAPHRARVAASVPAADVASLVAAAGVGPDDPLTRTLPTLLAEIRATDAERWQGEHTRLFDGPVACPINETAYVRRDKGVIIADLCGFYRAFGFEPEEETGEKPDHLVTELEFLAMVLAMLGQSRINGTPETTEVTRAAIRSFLDEHLGDWIASFCERIRQASDLPVHQGGLELLRGLWTLLAAEFDLTSFDTLNATPGEEAIVDDGTPYECDLAEPDDEAAYVPLTGPRGSSLPSAQP
ncbi:MAG: molecular chaperone TorD family protein [Phycisphaerales bacterium]|nr:molecular chaperone TorD family protein [Phycisphaerae bacterium]NNF42744.1 molecular chaperone TorD family protein [Phycisphaerales bacterium]NNM24508.1 molecular chaperone TorD family protein [Phycisphaerales bacterium]